MVVDSGVGAGVCGDVLPPDPTALLPTRGFFYGNDSRAAPQLSASLRIATREREARALLGSLCPSSDLSPFRAKLSLSERVEQRVAAAASWGLTAHRSASLVSSLAPSFRGPALALRVVAIWAGDALFSAARRVAATVHHELAHPHPVFGRRGEGLW